MHGCSFTPGPAPAGGDAVVTTWQRVAPVSPSCSGLSLQAPCRLWWDSLPVPCCEESCSSPHGTSLNKGLQSLHCPSGSAPSQSLPPDPNADGIVPSRDLLGEALHSKRGRGAGSTPSLWPAHAMGATGPPVTVATGPAAGGERMCLCMVRGDVGPRWGHARGDIQQGQQW